MQIQNNFCVGKSVFWINIIRSETEFFPRNGNDDICTFYHKSFVNKTLYLEKNIKRQSFEDSKIGHKKAITYQLAVIRTDFCSQSINDNLYSHHPLFDGLMVVQ